MGFEEGSTASKASPRTMERTNIIFPAIPLPGRHKRADCLASNRNWFPVASAELIICSFLSLTFLGVPVEPEVETSTKGLSEAQDNRNSPMELSKSFPWTKVIAEDTSVSNPRGMPFRLKSGWILCQFGCSIALCHKFFYGHQLPKGSVLDRKSVVTGTSVKHDVCSIS